MTISLPRLMQPTLVSPAQWRKRASEPGWALQLFPLGLRVLTVVPQHGAAFFRAAAVGEQPPTAGALGDPLLILARAGYLLAEVPLSGSILNGTVLDGLLIDVERRARLFLLDMLAYRGKEISHLPFEERHGLLRQARAELSAAKQLPAGWEFGELLVGECALGALDHTLRNLGSPYRPGASPHWLVSR